MTLYIVLCDSDLNFVECTETTSSQAMEKFAFENVLSRCLEEKLEVATIVTDRSQSIKKLMKAKKDIDHQFDVWHFAKNVASKLRAGSKKKDQQPFLEWIPAIINHLRYCSRSCQRHPQPLREMLTSILYHICNQHTWTSAELFLKCSHKPLTEEDQKRKKWLKPGTYFLRFWLRK